MKNDKLCINKLHLVLVVVFFLVVGLVLSSVFLTTRQSTSTNTRAAELKSDMVATSYIPPFFEASRQFFIDFKLTTEQQVMLENVGFTPISNLPAGFVKTVTEPGEISLHEEQRISIGVKNRFYMPPPKMYDFVGLLKVSNPKEDYLITHNFKELDKGGSDWFLQFGFSDNAEVAKNIDTFIESDFFQKITKEYSYFEFTGDGNIFFPMTSKFLACQNANNMVSANVTPMNHICVIFGYERNGTVYSLKYFTKPSKNIKYGR